METVNTGNMQVLACPHITLTRNPLISEVPNVAVLCDWTMVMVLEEGKIKMACWNCIQQAINPRIIES